MAGKSAGNRPRLFFSYKAKKKVYTVKSGMLIIAHAVGERRNKKGKTMNAKIKLAIWATMSALLFITFAGTGLGIAFTFALSCMAGIAALADHAENVQAMEGGNNE